MKASEILIYIGYFILLCMAFILLKFVSEFDYHLRKDKIEYLIDWEEEFKSMEGEKLVLKPNSDIVTIGIPMSDSKTGYIDIVTRAKTSKGCDNIIYLRDMEREIDNKVIASGSLDTITFRSHRADGSEIFSLQDSLLLDFGVVVQDSSQISEGHYFDVLNITVHKLKVQKPIF